MPQQSRLTERAILIAEIDDDPTSPIYTHGQPFDPMPLKAVHAVQCSTEAIAEIVRPFNPHVMVFPNQIAEMGPLRDAAEDNHVTIVFGAQNRESDWLPIMSALNRVVGDNWPRVHVQVIHDRAFFDALKTPLKMFRDFCPYDEYRSILRDCHIALLPLEDTPFNRCESDLKFLECAAEGVVALAGQTVYQDSIMRCNPFEHRGMTWYSVDNFEFWLRRFIKEPSYRERVTTNAYDYVHDHRMLAQHYRARHAWYLELLTSKEALHKELLSRCPELARSDAPASMSLQSVP